MAPTWRHSFIVNVTDFKFLFILRYMQLCYVWVITRRGDTTSFNLKSVASRLEVRVTHVRLSCWYV